MKPANLHALCAAAVALSAAVVVSGCGTSHADYSYTRQPVATGGTGSAYTQDTGTGTGTARATTGADQAVTQEQIVVPLYEETLQVGKRLVDAGGVRIRKEVTAETVNQPVQLREERLTIERIPAQGQGQTQDAELRDQPQAARLAQQDQNAQGAQAGQAGQLAQPFQESEIVIRLHREEPMVQKQMTQTGQIVARKSADTEQTTVQEQVRKETVNIEKIGNPENVTLSQNLRMNGQQPREAVGAAPAQGGQAQGGASGGQITDLSQFAQTQDKAMLEGREVRLSNVRVQQVIGDRLLLVGDGQNKVAIRTREPVQNIQVGDQINVSGVVHQFSTTAAQLQLDEQARQTLEAQQVYVEAARVEKAGQQQQQQQ